MNPQMVHPTRMPITDIPAYLKDCRELVKLNGDAEAANHIVICVKMLGQEIRKQRDYLQVQQNMYARTKDRKYSKKIKLLSASIAYYERAARA